MKKLSFKVLFLEQLFDLLDTERQTESGLVVLAEAVEDSALSLAIKSHVKETQKQLHRSGEDL